MGSMSNLTQFLLRHRACHGDKDSPADVVRVNAVVSDDMHIEVLEFFLDRVHLGLASPQTRQLMGHDHVILSTARRSEKPFVGRTIDLVTGSASITELVNYAEIVAST